MIRCLAVLAAFFILAACGDKSADNASTIEPTLPPDGIDQMTSISGKQAYEQACASCHDEGLDGAPRTGDPDAWSGRSSLWEAVLFEHATEGYLGMPAKGGAETLQDSDIARAAEYMLTLTFPDAPKD